MVHNDTNGPGLLPADTGFLQFCEGESTTFPDFSIVSDGLGTNSRTKEGEGANTKGSGFGFASVATTELTPWLVKPGADSALPVLAEVVIVEDYARRKSNPCELP